MSAETYQRIVAIFQEAVELPADERAAYVAEACGDAPDAAEVRARVLAMLAEDDADANGTLDERGGQIAQRVLRDAFTASQLGTVGDGRDAAPPGAPGSTGAVPAAAARLGNGRRLDPWLPDTIGGHQIVRKIGDGGMGTVFEAIQAHPRRTVALKTLRDGLPSDARTRRFEREIRLLARLEHPGIARMLDAGTTTIGTAVVPYFTMEFVRGQTIVRAAEERGTTLRDRLALIAEVCDAVQYAHQRGVIHRDLKPANILVENADDGRGAVRILDFGIARATDTGTRTGSDDVDAPATLATMTGQVIGTLPYMSPEQVTGDRAQIDTRTDVYSIGVVLYELLAGHVPLDVATKPIAEATRIIAESDPARLGTVDRRFQGEIETIAAKAMEKDPARRYASASELAADLRRYLNDEPIAARPATTLYQIRKFAKRHKVLVSAAAVVAASLVVAAAVSTRWAILADRSRVAEAEATALAKQGEAEMRWLSYVSGVTAAAALADENPIEARRLLDATPVEHRNWEWAFLDRWVGDPLTVLDGTDATWDPDGIAVGVRREGARLIVFDETGRIRAELPTALPPDAAASFQIVAAGQLVWLRRPAAAAPPTSTPATGPAPAPASTDVEVWHVATARAVARFDPTTHDVRMFDSTDARFAVVDRADGSARIIDGATGETIDHLQRPAGIDHWSFDPDGATVHLVRGEQRARVPYAALDDPDPWVRVDTRALAGAPTPATVQARFDRAAEPVRLVDLRTNAVLHELPGHTGGTSTAILSPDERVLATAGLDDAVRVWDVATGALLAAEVFGPPSTLAFAPDGRSLLTRMANGSMAAWRWPERTRSAVHAAHDRYVYSVAVSPDGTRYASGGWDGRIHVWRTADDSLEYTFRYEGERILGLSFTADGARLAAGISPAFNLCHAVWSWSLADGAPRLEAGDPLEHEACIARFWKLAQGNTPTTRFNGGVHFVSAPSGVQRAQVYGGYEITVQDRAAKSVSPPFSRPSSFVRSAAFDPTGTTLAGGGDDGTITLWSTETGDIVRRLSDRAHKSYALAYSPDGSRLAVGGHDGRIRILDVATGDVVLTLTGHDRYVHGLAFSPDGTTLVSGSGDTTVRVWRASRGGPSPYAARRTPDGP